jgi:hypothetical protein
VLPLAAVYNVWDRKSHVRLLKQRYLARVSVLVCHSLSHADVVVTGTFSSPTQTPVQHKLRSIKVLNIEGESSLILRLENLSWGQPRMLGRVGMLAAGPKSLEGGNGRLIFGWE